MPSPRTTPGPGRGHGNTNRITLQDGTVMPMRQAHRGWLMRQAPIDMVVTMTASSFSKKTLISERGYPERFHWPVFGDYNGAMVLIDAVMEKDVPKLLDLMARYPEHNFGLGDWFKHIHEEHNRAQAVEVRTLRRKPIRNGCELRLEAEIDTVSGARTARLSIYRGSRRVASEVLAHDPADAQLASPTISEEVSYHG